MAAFGGGRSVVGPERLVAGLAYDGGGFWPAPDFLLGDPKCAVSPDSTPPAGCERKLAPSVRELVDSLLLEL